MRQQSISLARSLLRPRISVTNANIISRSTPTFVPKHSTPSLFFHKNQIQFLTQHNRFYSSSTSTTTTASSSTPEATQPEKVEVPPTEAAPATTETTETTETTSSTETASEAATATEVNDNKVQSPLEKIIEQQKLEEEKERQQKEQQQQQKQQEKEEKEEEDDDEEEEEQAPPKKSFFERVFTVRNMLMPLSVLIALGAFYFYDPRQEYRERQIEGMFLFGEFLFVFSSKFFW